MVLSCSSDGEAFALMRLDAISPISLDAIRLRTRVRSVTKPNTRCQDVCSNGHCDTW